MTLAPPVVDAARAEQPGFGERVATKLRLTEGQLYTYTIGIVLALVAAAGALPPALSSAPRSAGQLAAGSQPALEPVPAPSQETLSPIPARPEGSELSIMPPAGRSTPVPAAAPPAAPSVASQPPARSTTTPPGPLEVSESGWATAVPIALGSPEVPDGGLPVSSIGGRDDKKSFVRLTGGGKELRLALRPEAGANVLDGQAQILACAITVADWKAEAGMSFDEAPPYSTEHCATGKRQENGSWTFDLSALGSQRSARGVALVPAPDSPTSRVTFDAG